MTKRVMRSTPLRLRYLWIANWLTSGIATGAMLATLANAGTVLALAWGIGLAASLGTSKLFERFTLKGAVILLEIQMAGVLLGAVFVPGFLGWAGWHFGAFIGASVTLCVSIGILMLYRCVCWQCSKTHYCNNKADYWNSTLDCSGPQL